MILKAIGLMMTNLSWGYLFTRVILILQAVALPSLTDKYRIAYFFAGVIGQLIYIGVTVKGMLESGTSVSNNFMKAQAISVGIAGMAAILIIPQLVEIGSIFGVDFSKEITQISTGAALGLFTTYIFTPKMIGKVAKQVEGKILGDNKKEVGDDVV